MIFKNIKARLIDEITEMFNHKKSMRLRLGVKFEVGKLEIDPFQDEEEEDETIYPDLESYHKSQMGKKEKTKYYIKDITSLIWSTKYKVCTKSYLNALIDEQYEELNKRFENLNTELGGSNWIIYRWHYIFAEGLTTKPQRASSYILTPEKYSNPKMRFS